MAFLPENEERLIASAAQLRVITSRADYGERDSDPDIFDLLDPMVDEEARLPPRVWIGGAGWFTPGTVSAISGPPGVFKSTLALCWAIALAAGIEWGGMKPERAYRVIYFAFEDDVNEMRRRVHAFAARYVTSDLAAKVRANLKLLPLENPLMLTGEGSRLPAPGEDWAKLLRTAKAHKAEVTFLDTVAETHDGDERVNQVMHAVLTPMRAGARELNIALVLVAHDRKSDAGSALERLRGGGFFAGIIRKHLPIRPMTEQQAKDWSVPPELAELLVCVEGGKVQYGRRPAPQWFIAAERTLANGDRVAAMEEWAPPAVDTSIEMRTKVLGLIARGFNGEPLSEAYNAAASYWQALDRAGIPRSTGRAILDLAKTAREVEVRPWWSEDERKLFKRLWTVGCGFEGFDERGDP